MLLSYSINKSRKLGHKAFSAVTKLRVEKRIFRFVQMLLLNKDLSHLPNIHIVYNYESDLRVLHD